MHIFTTAPTLCFFTSSATSEENGSDEMTILDSKSVANGCKNLKRQKDLECNYLPPVICIT